MFMCETCIQSGITSTFHIEKDYAQHKVLCESEDFKLCPFCHIFLPNADIQGHILLNHEDTDRTPPRKDTGTAKSVIRSVRPSVLKSTDFELSSNSSGEHCSTRRNRGKVPLSKTFTLEAGDYEELGLSLSNTKQTTNVIKYGASDKNIKGNPLLEVESDSDSNVGDASFTFDNVEASSSNPYEVPDPEFANIQEKWDEEKAARTKSYSQEELQIPLKEELVIENVKLDREILKTPMTVNGKYMHLGTLMLKSINETKKQDLHMAKSGQNIKVWNKERVREHLSDCGLSHIYIATPKRTFNENLSKVMKSAEQNYKTLKGLAETGGGELGQHIQDSSLAPSRHEDGKVLTNKEKLWGKLWEENLDLDKRIFESTKKGKGKTPKKAMEDGFMRDLLSLKGDRDRSPLQQEKQLKSEFHRRAAKRASNIRRESTEAIRRKKENGNVSDTSTTTTDTEAGTAIKDTLKNVNKFLDNYNGGNLPLPVAAAPVVVPAAEGRIQENKKDIKDLKKQLGEVKTKMDKFEDDMKKNSDETNDKLNRLLQRFGI